MSDIKSANGLVSGSLWQKIDNMDASLREFFENLKQYVRHVGGEDYRSYVFNRKEVRNSLRVR